MMFSLLGACLAVLAIAPASRPPQEDTAISATFHVSPREVEIGEPFRLVLDIEHPLGAGVFDLGADDLQLDASWVIFGQERFPPAASATEGRRVTRRIWTIASLDGGLRTLADVLTPLVFDARIQTVSAADTTIEVLGVLREGEDAPRPARGFPDGFGAGAETVRSKWRFAALGTAAALWLAFGALMWVRMRAGHKVAEAKSATPAERLDHLQAAQSARETSSDAARECHYALTRLVRDAAEVPLGAGGDRAGLTDQEWLVAARESDKLQVSCVQEIEQLFARAEEVKYAGATPSEWALDEAFGRARRTLELLGGSPAEGGGS